MRAKALGVELIAVGIRDIILPGEMKDLMNKVTEAKKATRPLVAKATAANLIARRA
jgi:regulator of protease activity HflC (stomatin/prohibitin superfamily)